MPTTTAKNIFRIGQFTFDARRNRLTKNGKPVKVPKGPINLFDVIVREAGSMTSNEDIKKKIYGDQPVDEEVARETATEMLALIEHLQGMPFGTLAREPKHGARLEKLLAPHQVFTEGMASAESRPADAGERARLAFEEALQLDPAFAPAHVGLANVYLLRYEATRRDIEPDRASLRRAARHAQLACRADPTWSETHATQAVVLKHMKRPARAIEAARRAVCSFPSWEFYYRLALVSWGQERIDAALAAQQQCPDLTAIAAQIAPVLFARGLWDDGLKVMRTGCHLQDALRKEGAGFSFVGLHWLYGTALLARGDIDAAQSAWAGELAAENKDNCGHVHTREVMADTWYAIGAVALREGRNSEAAPAFQRALTRLPGHGLAAVGLQAASGDELQTPVQGGNAMDRAMVQAAILVLQGQHRAAAGICAEALRGAESPSDGWMLPLDPLLDVMSRRQDWAEPLEILARNAR